MQMGWCVQHVFDVDSLIIGHSPTTWFGVYNMIVASYIPQLNLCGLDSPSVIWFVVECVVTFHQMDYEFK